MKIDELNINARSVPYETYFGTMNLTEKQKENREDFAKQAEELFVFLFALIVLYQQYETSINDVYMQKLVVEKYEKIIQKTREKILSDVSLNYNRSIEIDGYLKSYMKEFATTILETTEKHVDDNYYVSNDRAVFVAENEANTVLNYLEYEEAVAAGKTRKTWIDKRDKRERKTHLEIGRTTIGIAEAFLVGDSLMMFPKDISMGAAPEEIVNCRCTIKYS